MSGRFRVWLKFNVVGAVGIGVQVVVLTVLTQGEGLHYLVATAIAVESAVLHNFIWHERWTWRERTQTTPDGMAMRLVRFHFANGLTSIGGNLALVWVCVSYLGLGHTVANLAAITICSLANFWTSDRLVF